MYYQDGGYNGSKNVWEYYFYPVSDLSCSPNEPRNCSYSPDAWWFHYNKYKLTTRQLAHALIDAHISIIPPVQQKIDDFYQKNMAGKKTIGIHLRGTDKHFEVKPVSPSVIFEHANKQAELLGTDCQFLVATDEYALLEIAKKELKRPVIYYPSQRSMNGQPLHYGTGKKHGAVIGEEVLIEAQLLAHCDLFIHTLSNVSTAVLYFNPKLKNILLKQNKQKNVF